MSTTEVEMRDYVRRVLERKDCIVEHVYNDPDLAHRLEMLDRTIQGFDGPIGGAELERTLVTICSALCTPPTRWGRACSRLILLMFAIKMDRFIRRQQQNEALYMQSRDILVETMAKILLQPSPKKEMSSPHAVPWNIICYCILFYFAYRNL